MWFCSSCRNEIEEKYQHCWQCGAKRVFGVRPPSNEPPKEKSVPQFASYEELAKVPARPPFVFRRGPLQRLFWFVLAIVLVKFFASPFLGKYGLYIVIGGGLLTLIIILWRSFRRDPSEDVGIKLH